MLNLNITGKRYIGLSEDVGSRLQQHNNGESKWTARHRPWRRPANTDGKTKQYTKHACLAFGKPKMAQRPLPRTLKHSLSATKMLIRKRADNLKGLDTRDQDAFWILIYQIWPEADLRRQGQDFLADLKRNGFQFCRI